MSERKGELQLPFLGGLGEAQRGALFVGGLVGEVCGAEVAAARGVEDLDLLVVVG
ncbi:hypothetical protein ABZW30_34070 [Kitasatospora sp. NPDC004669]|uniref:hypothetical protein n=1 Tax=Kitasatospora sp. NPDC004669 TaxID=3154555 RepID=UPI0033BD3D99